DLMTLLLAPGARWPAQMTPLREWYQPLLELRHADAGVRASDLDMLQAVAGEFATRERFLTELTLDPPQASGDLTDGALRDEDYLILSTVHSAKGQEWDAVYVLNVTDGNFPNEYATSRRESIDEERRLLYVAMTRSRDALYLLEPQRWYVTQQPRYGPAYVHAARSRFLSPEVLACLDRVAPGVSGEDANAVALTDSSGASGSAGSAQPIVDVAGRLREMW
ncbi:MAG: 3'-5' exonuclease, partial [Burkholderiaceae bacterium]